MKLGILQTGQTSQALRPQFGDYADMFKTLLGPGHDYVVFDVREGGLPQTPEACEAYLITGSSSGVYDGDAWIDALIGFLRAAKGRAPLVGICFGHQVMAQAFGGQVEKSAKGWGRGLHTYAVRDRRPWMDEAASLSIPASHQDQVVIQPPHSRVTAASDFTAHAALAYDDQPAISFQGHPEFSPAYAQALIEVRRGQVYSDAEADAAIASLEEPNDSARVAEWIETFLQGHV